jgi:ribose 5-phosphate isomerase B
MKIAIGCDHGGLALKEIIKKYLKDELKHDYMDLGTFTDERCDYTDFSFLVGEAVANKRADFGIMIDGAGIGSSIMANKIPGVRAAVANEIYTARNSRAHNDANVLCLGSFVIGEGVAKEIVNVWLSTKFEGERNIKRVNKIIEFERRLNECRGK